MTRTLTLKEFGVYSLLSSTISIMCVTISIGIPQYILTKMHTFKEKERIESLFSIIFFQILCIILLGSLLLIPYIQNLILSYLHLEDYVFEFIIAIFIIGIGTIFNIISAYISSKRELNFVSFISFFYTCFWIILLIIFYLILGYNNVKMLFIIWCIGSLVSFIIILWYIKKDIVLFLTKIKRIRWKILKKALDFSFPLVPFVISYWILTIAGKYIINYYKGNEAVGIFSLMYALCFFIFVFPSIITGILYPYMAKAWSEKKNYLVFFNAQLKYNIMMIIPAMVGLFILRKPIITMMSGTEYLVGTTTMIILLPIPLLAALCNIYKLNLLLRENTKLIGIIYSCGTILNIILNFIMIPRWGINGAAISIVISYLFMVIYFVLSSKKQLVWDFDYLRIGKIIIASLLMGLSIYFINPDTFISKIFTIIFGALIFGVLLFWFNIFSDKEYNLIMHYVPKRFKK